MGGLVTIPCRGTYLQRVSPPPPAGRTQRCPTLPNPARDQSSAAKAPKAAPTQHYPTLPMTTQRTPTQRNPYPIAVCVRADPDQQKRRFLRHISFIRSCFDGEAPRTPPQPRFSLIDFVRDTSTLHARFSATATPIAVK